MTIQDIRRRVLELEGKTLVDYAQNDDPAFSDAIDLILQSKGRVIVSGMGKSGHIARKIAATFASTGTPAYFVHPAEASHGDLGMVTHDDVVLMLSNSGETPELAALIAHAKRLNIPLIGVASNPESTLLKSATVALVLPKAEEACPNGLAPTTSTTLTLALGDALAVALMEVRNFKPEHFQQFHPGGKLGKQLLYVRDLMHKNEEALPFVHIDASMQEAILEMTQKGFGITGVKDDDGYLFGVITDGDLRRNMEGLLSKKVVDVATRKPKLIQVTALAQEAVKIMEDSSITCLFVVDKGKPVGLLHIHDLLRQKLM
jgi:arabinose-5-phosphate isomerase